MENRIITSDTKIVDQPFDKYWDAPLSRREAQRAINKLAKNDSEMMGMCDTAALVLNFLCEKLGVKREEIQTYVDKKKIEVQAMREALKQQAEEAANAESNV